MKSVLKPENIKILIPCHNCSPFITQCLRSLQNQGVTGWQAFVSDDASHDDTADKVKPFLSDPRFQFMSHKKRQYLMGNIYAGFNQLSIKPNDIVAILDGDDYLLPGALEKIWQVHCEGYDIVYSDYDCGNKGFSYGRQITASIPIRQQLWSFSHFRTFKGYLLSGFDDCHVRDSNGQFFRAAGDLSLYFPLAEKAGLQKILFVPEQLYYYRIHDNCNHNIRRTEQLKNNWEIRTRPPLPLQTEFFDFTKEIFNLEKPMLRTLAKEIREQYPMPYSVCILNNIEKKQVESWLSYNNLWLGEGVFLKTNITI